MVHVNKQNTQNIIHTALAYETKHFHIRIQTQAQVNAGHCENY